MTLPVHTSTTKRRGVDPRYWTPEEEKRLEQLRCVDGLSHRQIAEKMGRTKDSVEGKIARMGLEMPADWDRQRKVTAPINSLKMAAIRRYWMRGATTKEAATALGVGCGRVQNAYRRFSREARAAEAATLELGTFIGGKEMMAIVAPICGVTPAAITGPSRLKSLVCARIAIAKALRERGRSYPVIARALGRTDHSTAWNWAQNFEAYCRVYPETRRAYDAIKLAEARAAERLAA